MGNLDFTRNSIDQFFAAIEPLKDAYQLDSFSYVAINTDSGAILIQGTLFLNVQPPALPLKTFQSNRVRAEHFYLKDIDLTRERAIANLLAGSLTTPMGTTLSSKRRQQPTWRAISTFP